MLKHPDRLWIVALLLGWSFDFLFWQKPAGINFPIYAVLCLLGGLFLLVPEGIHPERKSLWLLVPLAFFAAVTILRREPLTALLAYTLTLFSLSLFVLTYLGGRWMQYSLSDYVAKYFDLIPSLIGRPITYNQEIRKTQVESATPRKSRPFWPVLRGIAIALPVVAVFATLLASADAIFSQQLDHILQFFRLENLSEYLFRFVYILVGAYFIAAILLHAAARSRDEKLLGEDKPLVTPFLGFTESSIVLGSVGLLFLAFVVIQFQYFFGGHANIRIDGYTYSEYARRGFGELLAVAFFTLLMLLSLGGVTRRASELQRRIFSGLGVGLVVLVLVMLVSAYQRVALYESAYGFSRLRTYTHVSLVWIGLLLVATIVLEILRRERAFALVAVLAAFGFAVSISLLNVDAFIVRQNVQRERQGQAQVSTDTGRVTLDSSYFVSLSDDAVPAIVDAYRSKSLPDATRKEVGAALACIRYERSQSDASGAWQSFHFSRFYADRALATIDKSLDAYQLQDENGPAMVEDSAGAQYPCSSNYYD